MTESDILQVKQIEEACQISSWSLTDYKNEIERQDSLAFVVKKQSSVIGFILARPITTQITTESEKVPDIAQMKTDIEIYNIAVSPSYQNQGIGQKLINQLVNHTANLPLRSIWLEVRESNLKAIKFYEKNGFTIISKRKSYYSDPVEDAITMTKTVEDSIKLNLIH